MKKLFNIGDVIVFPIGAMEYKDRYKLIQGKIIDIRGSWLFGYKYCVFYNFNGFDKIERFNKHEIYKKRYVYDCKKNSDLEVEIY